jgi:AcrR family transcriptional regulator
MARISKPPEERKREIVEMAKKLFAGQGYEKTQISDITKALNVSHGLVYHYFKSKQEVFDAVVDSMLEEGFVMVNKIAGDHNLNPLEKFDAIFNLFGKQPGDLTRIMVAVYNEENQAILDRVVKRRSVYLIPLMEKIIEEGCASGHFECPYPKQAAWFCIYGEMGIKNQFSEGDSVEDLLKVLRLMYDRVLGIKKAERV